MPRAVPAVTASLLKIVGIYFCAWTTWYYAVFLGSELKDKVCISILDFWPGLFITISLCFIPAWNSNATGRGRIGAAYRAGAVCAPACLKTVVGGGFFFFGSVWGVAIALHRFFIPLSRQPKPVSLVPGYLMLLHIGLLMYEAYAIFHYNEVVANGGVEDEPDVESAVI